MVTFSFDEYGNYEEGKTGNGNISFVAGVLYDDKGLRGERNAELNRIQEYLKTICKDAGTPYPDSLHYQKDKFMGRAESVEIIFEKTLSDFLNKGIYKGRPVTDIERKGEYHVFSYIKTREGKTQSITDSILNPYGEYALSSLYTYMVTDAINHMIFNNPILTDLNDVFFDLPTRSYYGNLTEEEKRQYGSRYNIRPKNNKEGQDKDIVFITGVEVFRTAIERELYYSNKNIIVEEIKCRPISYKSEKIKDFKDYGFLYLSDLLCAVISKDVNGRRYKIGDINIIPKRLDMVSGKKGISFFYDTTDTYYSRALNSVNHGDYMEALDNIYTGVSCKSECSDYYKKRWFPFLVDMIRDNIDPNSFSDAVRKLKRYSLSNNIEQERLIYLVKTLEDISSGLEFDNDDKRAVLYDFYQVAATAYNHLAKTRDANKCIRKAEEYVSNVSLEQRLDLINKETVSMCDELDFSRAVLKAHKMQKAWEQISDIRQVEFNEKTDGIAARKGYSQLGQVYAFAGDPRAEYMFEKSIDKNNDSNAIISMSYLLHYYAEQGMKTKYENMSKRYFGGMESLSDRLKYIINEGAGGNNPVFSLKFALYVYVRGIYVFHLTDLCKDQLLCESLMNIKKYMESINPVAIKEINGHPWEIIYKYLALIALEIGNKGKADEFIKRSETILNKEDDLPSYLLRSIIAYGKLEFIEKKDGKAERKIRDAIDNCWKEICAVSPRLETEYKESKDRNRENLRFLMTYMYH